MIESKKHYERPHMFRLGTEHPWFCSYGFDLSVDFCIWVLEVDGLRIPPFDHHVEGDGTLRTAGLDAESWQSWMREVISTKDIHEYHARQKFAQLSNDIWKSLQAKGEFPKDTQSDEYRQAMQNFQQQVLKAQQAQPDIFFPKPLHPPDVWKGNATVRKRLGELWEQYGPISHKRRAWERNLRTQGSGTSNNLWHDLEPYHSRLDSLIIHFVGYPQQIDYPVPPLSAIMSIDNGHLDYENFRTRALWAAEALSKHN